MTLNRTAEHRAATELFNLGTLLELKPVIFLFLHLLILHDRQTKENFFFVTRGMFLLLQLFFWDQNFKVVSFSSYYSTLF